VAERPSDPESRRSLSGMGLVADIAIPGAAEFAAAARQWFATLPGLLAPEEWEEVLREEKPLFRGKPQEEWPLFDDYQEPFTVWAEIIIAPRKWRGMRVWHRRATKRNLESLDDQLADRPVSAQLSMFRVDANGIELPGGLGIRGEAALALADDQVPVGRLTVGDTMTWRPGARPVDAGELCARQAGLARAWAGRADVISLFGGEEVGRGGETALADSLSPKLNWWEAALRWDLQGYSWITFCSAGVAERLGGAAALGASGAFYRVDEMPGGGVLLQATERAADYGIKQARKVFDVLAPVLPEGLPEKPANWSSDLPWLVIPEDSAWRSAAGPGAQRP